MAESKLRKFRETLYPHRRSEGESKRWNRGLRELDRVRVHFEQSTMDSDRDPNIVTNSLLSDP